MLHLAWIALLWPVSWPTPAQDRRALLVGISRYAPEAGRDFEDLEGPGNDILRAREMLLQHYGFEDEDVRVLLDEAATHSAIVRAFEEHLIRGATEDTQALFWFAGHGSRVPDRSGLEDDGADSTLLAFDSRAQGRKGEFDLCDDELRSLFLALTERTGKVTIVVDACHSGGTLRGTPEHRPRVRALPPGSKALDPTLLDSFWPDSIARFEDDGPAPRLSRYVQLAACSEREQAVETLVPTLDGARVHGLFSHSLLEELERLGPGVSCRRLGDEVTRRVWHQRGSQNVWLEGDSDRVWLSGEYAPPPVGFQARFVKSNELSIDGGLLDGLWVDSTLAVMQAGRRVATAEVRRVGPNLSNARLTQGELDPASALWVVEVRGPRALPPLVVGVGDAACVPRLADLMPAIEFVLPGERQSDLELRLVGDSDGRARWVLLDDQGLIPWMGADIEPGGAQGLDQHLDKLVEVLRGVRQHQQRELLAELPGDLRVLAHFVDPSQDSKTNFDKFASNSISGLSHAPSHSSIREYQAIGGSRDDGSGRRTVLWVENPHAFPVYIGVISIAEDYTSGAIFPAGGVGAEAQHLAPGQSRDFAVLVMRGSGHWPSERLMRDRYLILASKEYIDFGGFQCQAVPHRGPEEPPQAPLVDAAAQRRRVLIEALCGARGSTRKVAYDDPSAFGVTEVDLLVRAP